MPCQHSVVIRRAPLDCPRRVICILAPCAVPRTGRTVLEVLSRKSAEHRAHSIGAPARLSSALARLSSALPCLPSPSPMAGRVAVLALGPQFFCPAGARRRCCALGSGTEVPGGAAGLPLVRSYVVGRGGGGGGGVAKSPLRTVEWSSPVQSLPQALGSFPARTARLRTWLVDPAAVAHSPVDPPSPPLHPPIPPRPPYSRISPSPSPNFAFFSLTIPTLHRQFQRASPPYFGRPYRPSVSRCCSRRRYGARLLLSSILAPRHPLRSQSCLASLRR